MGVFLRPDRGGDLQNLWCYFDLKKDYPHFKLDDSILFQLQWTCVKWPDFFPDLLFIYERISETNEPFCPGPPCNEKNFLINFGVGEKMNKKRVEQKYCIYVVFNFIYFSLQQKFLSKCEFVKQLETVLQNAVT